MGTASYDVIPRVLFQKHPNRKHYSGVRPNSGGRGRNRHGHHVALSVMYRVRVSSVLRVVFDASVWFLSPRPSCVTCGACLIGTSCGKRYMRACLTHSVELNSMSVWRQCQERRRRDFWEIAQRGACRAQGCRAIRSAVGTSVELFIDVAKLKT